jgi:hypothetical protein
VGRSSRVGGDQPVRRCLGLGPNHTAPGPRDGQPTGALDTTCRRIDLAAAAVIAFATSQSVAPGPQVFVFDDEPAA